jgi:hypothetical protein
VASTLRSAAKLVGGWINVVLEEEKGAPQKLLFLFPDCERPLACGEGIGRSLFQLAVDTGGILQSSTVRWWAKSLLLVP